MHSDRQTCAHGGPGHNSKGGGTLRGCRRMGDDRLQSCVGIPIFIPSPNGAAVHARLCARARFAPAVDRAVAGSALQNTLGEWAGILFSFNPCLPSFSSCGDRRSVTAAWLPS